MHFSIDFTDETGAAKVEKYQRVAGPATVTVHYTAIQGDLFPDQESDEGKQGKLEEK